MFRKEAHLKAIKARKHLLMAENEVNQAGLLKEIENFKSEVAYVKKQLRAVGSIIISATLFAITVSIFSRGLIKAEAPSER